MILLNKAVILIFSMVLLAGCTPGLGGRPKIPPGFDITKGLPQYFSSFSNVPNNGTTVFHGTSGSASYTADGTGNVTSISDVSRVDSATLDMETRNGVAVAIRIKAPGARVSFNKKNGDKFTTGGSIITVGSANGQDALIMVDNEGAGFEYQTFGAWETGLGTGAGAVGVGSFGARTASSALPAGTTANYNGGSIGVVSVISNGRLYTSSSDVTVATDFSTVSISSTGTDLVGLNNNFDYTDVSVLDFTGSGKVSGSGFSAVVNAPDASGGAVGRFYGPRAQEVGGVFALKGSDVNYVGSFGAKK